jgi:tetratricopeptide (TPR) repeat protein
VNSEAIILAIGILSALTGLQGIADVKKKKLIFKVLFFASIATALATNIFQYTFAVTNKAQGRKEVENATAIALQAFEGKDMATLNKIAPNSFLKGYRMFKDGNDEAAETFFQYCVDKDEFTAPSKYLLAFLKSHTNRVLNPDGNYDAALKLLEEVIESDPEYSPAFYLKGKLLANSNKPEEAFQALHEAVTTKNGYSPCRDINNAEEVEKFFSALIRADQARLTRLQRDCARIQNLAPTPTPTPTPMCLPTPTPTPAQRARGA